MQPIDPYFRDSITNGNPHEQALIRRWWHESHKARGWLIWEYPLFGRWLDAIWFPEAPEDGIEQSGLRLPGRFPIRGIPIVLCEAKLQLTPALIGQALVHAFFARRAGAIVQETIVFAETGAPDMRAAASDLGLSFVLPDGTVSPDL